MTEDVEARALLKSEARKNQFEDLREYLQNEVPDSVTEKSGNSAVTRFAIKLAHNKMEELQEERELKAREFQKLQKEMKELAENV
jgi:gas vesicle protein